MKRWQWVVLIFELSLIALILILPQVDLPDFTFHGATAPVAAKARASVQRVQTLAVAIPPLALKNSLDKLADAILPKAPEDSVSRLLVLCILLC